MMAVQEEMNYSDEEMRISLEKAMAKFTEDGIETLPSMGPHEDPGFLLVYPDETITLSCCRMDTEETALYRYTLFVYDDDPWSFPSFFMPDALEGIQLLPLLYRAIRLGMPDDRQDRRLQESYVSVRLPRLQEILAALSIETELLEPSGGFPYLIADEAGEELQFSYACVFPEWEAAVLRIESEKKTAYLPEFGALMTQDEYAALLSQVCLFVETNEEGRKADAATQVFFRLIGASKLCRPTEKANLNDGAEGEKSGLVIEKGERYFTHAEAVKLSKETKKNLSYSTRALGQLATIQIIDMICGQKKMGGTFPEFETTTGTTVRGEKKFRGITSRHAYTILGLQVIDGKEFVQIRNPGGKDAVDLVQNKTTGNISYREAPLRTGVFYLDIEMFCRFFRTLYAVKNPAPAPAV